MGQPVYVLPNQDHMAHLQVHLPFLKSPMFGSSPAIANTYMYPMALHLRDHLLNYYLSEAHDAIDKAQSQELIPEEAEEQVSVILKVQQFIEQQLGEFGQELSQITEMAQQFKPTRLIEKESDAMQIAQLSAQLKQGELAQRAELEAAKLQLEQVKLEQANQMAQFKMQQTAEIERANLAVKQAEREDKAETQALQEMSHIEQNNISEMSESDRLNTREQGENMRKAEDLAARERMNTQDNQTAKDIALLKELNDRSGF